MFWFFRGVIGGVVNRVPNCSGPIQVESRRSIAQEIISALAGQHGTTLRVTIDIEAERPEGFTESTMRTVTENARTLKITDTGFE